MRTANLLPLLALVASCSSPHLVVRATGEDLGVSLGGTVARSEIFDGAIDFARPVDVYLDADNFGCVLGHALLDVDGRTLETRYVLPNGVLVEPNRRDLRYSLDATVKWERDSGGAECRPIAARTVVGPCFSWVLGDDGAVTVPQYDPPDLELR